MLWNICVTDMHITSSADLYASREVADTRAASLCATSEAQSTLRLAHICWLFSVFSVSQGLNGCISELAQSQLSTLTQK